VLLLLCDQTKPSSAVMSPTIPTRSVPPDLGVCCATGAGVGVLTAATGAVVPVGAGFAAAGPAAAVGGCAEMVGAAGCAALPHAASNVPDAVAKTTRKAARLLILGSRLRSNGFWSLDVKQQLLARFWAAS
jgi:hypothetical protein